MECAPTLGLRLQMGKALMSVAENAATGLCLKNTSPAAMGETWSRHWRERAEARTRASRWTLAQGLHGMCTNVGFAPPNGQSVDERGRECSHGPMFEEHVTRRDGRTMVPPLEGKSRGQDEGIEMDVGAMSAWNVHQRWVCASKWAKR